VAEQRAAAEEHVAAVAEQRAAVVVGIINQRFVMFLV
jgi:hypothetical protein